MGRKEGWGRRVGGVGRGEKAMWKICSGRDVRWELGADLRNVLLDVGAVGQVGENGVHVLHVSDADGQISQPGQGSQFVLILIERER